MTINRDFWLLPFPKGKVPNWTCPRCGRGILRPIDNGFLFAETGDIHSEIARHGEYFDYCAYTFHYSVLLKCNNPDCEEPVASGGYGYVDEDVIVIDGRLKMDEMGSPDTKLTEVFLPVFFYPPIDIFKIPSKCPEAVTQEIRSSFKLFFSDPPAAANYVRKAAEEILTTKNINRFSAKNKRAKISLHDRIVEFQKSDPESAQRLLAIKWLGNEGSHSNAVTKNDVLDAYEILEILLDILYVGYHKAVERKVIQINKRKKPLHPST